MYRERERRVVTNHTFIHMRSSRGHGRQKTILPPWLYNTLIRGGLKKQADRQAGRQAGRQTGTQADRQTGTQAQRQDV